MSITKLHASEIKMMASSPLFSPFIMREVTEQEKLMSEDISSCQQSILKTPTASFRHRNGAVLSGRRLRFSTDLSNDRSSVESKGSQDSDKEPFVEVVASPNKIVKISPEAWKAHQAYNKYQNYSNESEKTDYTYSRLSPFYKREIAPGIPIRPNMSRKPLISYKIYSKLDWRKHCVNLAETFADEQDGISLLQKLPFKKLLTAFFLLFFVLTLGFYFFEDVQLSKKFPSALDSFIIFHKFASETSILLFSNIAIGLVNILDSILTGASYLGQQFDIK